MKRALCIVLIMTLLFALTGCDKAGAPNPSESPEPTASGKIQLEGDSVKDGGETVPGFGSDRDRAEPEPEPTPVPPTPTPPKPGQNIYELSALAKGSHDIGADQGMPGMIETFMIEFQYYCTDAYYPSGRYRGSVYAEMSLDASEAFAEMTKYVPKSENLQFTFDGSAYAMSNGVTALMYGFSDYEYKGNIWLTTLDASGNKVEPSGDQYVITSQGLQMNFKSTLTAGGSFDSSSGASGKVGNFDFSGDGLVDIGYRMIVEPDSVEGDGFYNSPTGERKVKLYVYVPTKGDPWVIEGAGTLKRIATNMEGRINYDPPPPLNDKYGGIEDTAPYSGGPEADSPAFMDEDGSASDGK